MRRPERAVRGRARLPGIDLCEYHDYGAPAVPIPGDQWNGLQVRIDQCTQLDKPIFVGEAGIKPEDLDGTLLGRADAFAAKIEAQTAAGVRGFLAWAWSPPSGPSTLDNYDIGAGDPALAVLGGSPVITQIAPGSEHTCALASNGDVWCWGGNGQGELGDGTRIARFAPVLADVPPNVVEIATGGEFTCALTSAGKVWCWGNDQYGQLGSMTGSNSNPEPHLVPGIPSDIEAIDIGAYHACALTETSDVWCWGYNAAGQVGVGWTSPAEPPTQVPGLSGVDQLSLGGYHSCVLRGVAVTCWGNDSRGQVGDGPPADFSVLTPTDVIDLPADAAVLGSGTYHTCAIDVNASLSCWGHGAYGELGNDSDQDQLSAAPVAGLVDVSAVTGGSNRGGGSAHTCALADDGLRCWGSNWAGQLGDGSTIGRDVPTPVHDLPYALRAINAGGNHTCVLLDSWSVQCWGANDSGQVGDATTTSRSTPVDVAFGVVSSPADAPGDVQVLAGDEQVTVSWTAPASDGGHPILRYIVSPNPTGSAVVVDAPQTQAVVTGLTNGSTYTFTVAAITIFDEGPARPRRPRPRWVPRILQMGWQLQAVTAKRCSRGSSRTTRAAIP